MGKIRTQEWLEKNSKKWHKYNSIDYHSLQCGNNEMVPSLINTIYLTKVAVRWLHASSSMLAMILIRVKFYIAVGFLSTILHVVPRIRVVKTNYEASICDQQNIVKMEACTYRQHHIKQ